MKKFLYTLSLVIIVCTTTFTLSSCHTREQHKQGTFLEMTDSYDRQIRLEQAPQRIVSLSPAITEMLYLIGAENKLVGISDYCNYPEATAKLPKVGGMQNINLEALAALHPDVVLVGSIVSKKDVESIEKMNIPVIALIEESSIENLSTMITTLGKITDCQTKADQEAESWKSEMAILKAKASTQTAHKSVYYVVGFGDAGDYTAPNDSHINEIIELAGGRNIGASLKGWSISREFLFESDPDIILVREEDKDAFCKQHPYTQLKAVKEGHVYPINSGWIDIVSPRNIQAVKMIQEVINK